MKRKSLQGSLCAVARALNVIGDSAEGIVEAVPASDGSVYQEYVITIKGRALLPTLVALAQWSSEYLFERREVRSVPIDAKMRRPLKKLVLHSEDGQLLDAGEILIRASGVSF